MRRNRERKSVCSVLARLHNICIHRDEGKLLPADATTTIFYGSIPYWNIFTESDDIIIWSSIAYLETCLESSKAI